MRVYFKNLDGIRFFAALMVILQHTSEYLAYANNNTPGLNLPNAFKEYFKDYGSYGVTLFFVLSGYLIFYLLFTEHKTTNTVNVRNFYIRRILRIWPLYMGFGLVLIFGIDYVLGKLGTPIHTPVAENLLYLFTFSINLQMLFAIPNKGIIELYWSVCIEEQFYLFAPWLVKKWANKMLYVIVGLIAVGLVSKYVFHYIEVSRHLNLNNNNPLYFFTLCRLDNFGIGALAAYIYFRTDWYAKVQHIVTNRIIQAIVIVFTILFVSGFIPQPQFAKTYLFSTIPSILFAYLILAASTGEFVVNLENKPLKLLGKYSYGIYVFHAVISELVMVAFIKFIHAHSVFIYNVVYPLTSVAVTAVVAGLSYEIYEKRFLKLKEKFAIIKSHKV